MVTGVALERPSDGDQAVVAGWAGGDDVLAVRCHGRDRSRARVDSGISTSQSPKKCN